MLTQKAIAADWGCDQTWISRCVKHGIKIGIPVPRDTFENARLWRQAHASKRPPVHSGQIAKIAQELDDDSPQARASRREYLKDKPNGTIPPSEDLQDALLHAIELENEAYRLARDAMVEEKEGKIQVRLAIHNKAQENRVKIETMIREELAARETLIPFDRATEIFRRGLDVILRRLKRFPQEKASACNPQNPFHALGILETGIDSIITEVQGQYGAPG